MFWGSTVMTYMLNSYRIKYKAQKNKNTKQNNIWQGYPAVETMGFWYVLKEISRNIDQQTVFQETVTKVKSTSCNC